jgi:hypothetical protein
VWDELVVEHLRTEWQIAGGKGYFDYASLGEYILSDAAKNSPDLTMALANATDAFDWYEESRALQSVVYPDSNPVSDPKDRKYCKIVDPKTGAVLPGNFDQNAVPTIDADYFARSNKIVKVQILRAGYRLAGMLNRLAETVKLQPQSPNKAAQVIQGTLLRNAK